MPETIEKGIQRAMGSGVESTYNKILRSPEAIKLLSRAYTQYGTIGVNSAVKEMDASLSDDDVATVSDSVISQIFGRAQQGDAYGSWQEEEDDEEDEEAVKALRNVVYNMVDKHFPGAGSQFSNFRKEFDDVLAQVSQPKGGTENLTNVSSPGAPPGKISAVPGTSGGYGRTAQTIGEPRKRVQGDGSSGFYDTNKVPYSDSTYRASGIAAQRSPTARIPTSYGMEGRSDQVGPVGDRGGTSRIPSTSNLKPSNVSPGQGSTSSQYKDWSHNRSTIAPTQIDKSVSYDRKHATRVLKKGYRRYNNEEDDEVAGVRPSRLSVGPQLPNTAKTDEEDFSYGQGAQTPPDTRVPGDYSEPVGWSQSSGDQATEWSNDPSASPNQTFDATGMDDLTLFGEEETEEERASREEAEALTGRSEELDEYARVADRQAEEAGRFGEYEARDELKSKAVQLRSSAMDLRKRIKSSRALTK